MSALPLPPVPASLKPIAHLLKLAQEHETRDPVVTYWARLAALQSGMKMDKASKEALALLLPLMDWLEKEKKVLKENEAVSNEVVASAHVENYAMKLFAWADKQDRAAVFNKNVVKIFYTSGQLFEVMSVFGELSPENAHAKKYAKWKAAYINNCLKNGETPVPGPAGGDEEEEGEEGGAAGGAGGWAAPQIPDAASVPTPDAVPPPPAAAAAAMPTPAAAVPTPTPSAVPMPSAAAAATGGSSLTAEQISRTQKLCKFTVSALDYNDKATAITNLEKALRLLQTGSEN